MGVNPTQAQAVVLFIVAFTLISAGMAMGGNFLAIALGVVLLGVSIMLFLKCKPWEHNEQ